MHTWSRTTCHAPVDDSLDDAFNANDWEIEADLLQTLAILPVPLSLLELLEGQKYDLFCQLNLVTNARDPNSGFYADDKGLLHNRRLSILNVSRLLYTIISEVDYVPWLTTKSWQDTLPSDEYILFYSRPTFGHRWLLM